MAIPLQSQAVARARAVGAFLKTRQLLLSPLSRARPDRVPRSRAQRGYPVSTRNFKTMFCSVAGQKSLKSHKMIILIDVFYYCIKRVVSHKINHLNAGIKDEQTCLQTGLRRRFPHSTHSRANLFTKSRLPLISGCANAECFN